MATYKVGYFVGSLATASINRLLAKALVRLAPPELTLTEIPFRDLPLYSYDYDADFPSGRQGVQASHRRRRRGAVRHARIQPLDPRRPEERDRLGEPPVGDELVCAQASAVIGTSPGAIGTAVAQQQLRSVLSFCNSPQMNSPEAYIQFKPGLIDGDGQVTNASTAEFLRKYMAEFHAFIVRVTKVLPKNP